MKKRILAAVLVVAFVFGTFAVNAGAATIKSLAKEKFEYPGIFDIEFEKNVPKCYKLVIKEAGTLKIEFSDNAAGNKRLTFGVWSSGGEKLWNGGKYGSREENLTLGKGTYYLALERKTNGKVNFHTSFKKDNKPEMQLTYTLKKGKSLTDGAELSTGDGVGKVSWKSSKKSLAKVNSKRENHRGQKRDGCHHH
ncbi:MAG: hypothetical protein LBI36_06765 [Oscillospiraceae bacterium]|jgi:hypothetical protein|nr:hypothetical protein [Oscillospiraceae bacterium]